MRLSTQQFHQVIFSLCASIVLLLTAPLKAETVDQIFTLNDDSVDTFLVEMISDYQRFQQEVIDYRRFYEERGDHRGYMVWRQNAFSPTVRNRNAFYQAMLEHNRQLIETQQLEPVFRVFDSLERFSVDVMQGFVEQDFEAIQNARNTLNTNRQVIEELKLNRALEF
ncbi:hypothetical protein MPL1_04937 [Methylophaga lonarensis MPL]|uniref:Uncharacterized protein n=2 Tax=Methylophaga lonarensis TaxID=999151 RepID=M7PHV8_9GAMM|nr:hypothetical protein [Methylophaga lonarensis]EMR13475.1 hypothetical protein MPL1_04937 [Methylophaga lonarensis MPL]